MNVSTPRELLLLGGTVMARHPDRWKYFGVPEWSYNGTTFRNTTSLISTYPGMDGGKSGYVRASGFNLSRRRAAAAAGSWGRGGPEDDGGVLRRDGGKDGRRVCGVRTCGFSGTHATNASGTGGLPGLSFP